MTNASIRDLLNQLIAVSSIAIFAAACSSAPKAPAADAAASTKTLSLPTTLDEAVHSEYRSKENVARDGARHPMETLNFFGLQPNMTVLEIAPGAGWYTEILAPLLTSQGHYIGGGGSTDPKSKYQEWLKKHPDVAAKAEIVAFDPGNKPIVPNESVDMVVTFRNVHNWIADKKAKAAFKAFFAALKPGGILGVEDHRANAKKKPKAGDEDGYVLEKDMLKLAKDAGFQLVEKSEINANPKDTKDYPEGVWTLPPTLRLGDKDKEKYLAIGESDRMTMKFVKPAGKKSSKKKK